MVQSVAEEAGLDDVLEDNAPVVAYEENSRFVVATLDYSKVESLAQADGRYVQTRRVLVWPGAAILIADQYATPSGEDAGNSCQVVTRATDDRAASTARATSTTKSSTTTATVTTADHVYRLTLPAADKGAGHITIEDAGGNTVLAKRPLPSGVLPHGEEGAAMIERWDRAYRDGRRPPWDAGSPDEELVRVVEEGIVRPCRTAVLGCGSGTNAIYLASKGFDVTAIDVAPTALAIAEGKATEAEVEVDWVLADVLNLPEMEPFDFVFDRGCYHNVRYVDAKAFVDNLKGITKPGSRSLILSLDRDGPPGVRKSHMEEDFADGFEIQWMEQSGLAVHGQESARKAWSLMLKSTE